eukprot:m.218760 g.218760  ORF g.218760 m.218760 type:complete len:50 (+) comp39904_c0_seq14:1016-1165(+)
MLLNGKLLALENGDLPSLEPMTIKSGNRINLPSSSYGFFVPHKTVAACM